jgi:hypothetical protein
MPTPLEQFHSDGFLIIRNAIPADKLESLRNSVDTLVARARAADPSWDTTPAPRTPLCKLVDADTLDVVDVTQQDNILRLSAELLDCPRDAIALTVMHVLCNPEFEPETPLPGQGTGTDPRNWHRDIRPDHDGPLAALIDDVKANGTGYVQWNIALYDDSVLHVVPGSHLRLDTEDEADQLRNRRDTQSPLPGEAITDLKAGDGVVYINMLLHWGSRYTCTEKRRTIQIAYRSFGRILPNQNGSDVKQRLTSVLPADTPQHQIVSQWFKLYRAESAVFEAIFRAALAEDQAAFDEGLAKLHPATEGRLTCIILLSIIVRNLAELSQTPEVGTDGDGPLGPAIRRQLADQFTTDELQRLQMHFEPVDQLIRTDTCEHISGFLGKPMAYAFEKLPEDATAAGVTAAMFA